MTHTASCPESVLFTGEARGRFLFSHSATSDYAAALWTVRGISRARILQ